MSGRTSVLYQTHISRRVGTSAQSAVAAAVVVVKEEEVETEALAEVK